MRNHPRSTAPEPSFPEAAHRALDDSQLRRNVRHATGIIQAKRDNITRELPDWEELRVAARAIKAHTLRYLDFYLEEFERNVTEAGGKVHWAADAGEANRIIGEIIQQCAAKEVIKVKTMTSHETRLNSYLEELGIAAHETDLADLIVQLGNDHPSHIVVPALHINRTQVREIFERKMPLHELGMESLSDDPQQLAEAARRYLRQKFLTVNIGISGANFAIAETGAVVIVESEGNARMCITLPDVLITLIGIEKIIPSFRDLEIFLQLLPRSATGERMNPYTSVWTGVKPGDGPQEFHLVLLDNGRTGLLGRPETCETLHCIRCGACLNTCPVYHQTGGHAYGSVYQGPIGAILTPQLQNLEHARSLPFASSLCGACYDVCPVKIDIPEILLLLRGEIVRQKRGSLLGKLSPENIAMQAAALLFSASGLLSFSEALARIAQWPFVHDRIIHHLPGQLSGWTATRDLPALPRQSFRHWWAAREKNKRP